MRGRLRVGGIGVAARVERLAGFVMENAPFPIEAPIATAVTSHLRPRIRLFPLFGLAAPLGA